MGDYVEEIPNYTGPYISNGSIQSSVEFGDRPPKDQLDALSRLHDSAYAKWDDRLHRTVADSIYNQEAQKLVGKFPELAGNLVLYGNHTTRSAVNIYAGYKSAGPVGALFGAVENMYDMNNLLINGDKTRKEIKAYYGTDPHKEYQTFNPQPQSDKAVSAAVGSTFGLLNRLAASGTSTTQTTSQGKSKQDRIMNDTQNPNDFNYNRSSQYNHQTWDGVRGKPYWYYPNHRYKKQLKTIPRQNRFRHLNKVHLE